MTMRHPEHESGDGVVKLTPAEAEVVAQAVRGLTNKEIARALRKSELTVKNQLGSVYRKLGLKRRLQLIAQFRA
jgi:DNA-binding CsgD family transcriptional regulator